MMLYASELTRTDGVFKAILDDEFNQIPDLIARLLADAVELRLRRDFSRGYRQRAMPLSRVRGRIDVLVTEARQLLSKGEVFCHFQELTIDTPRNRLVRAALESVAHLVSNKPLAHRCRTLAAGLARLGVDRTRPSRAEMASDQIGRNEAGDASMVALARLCFDLALPTEQAGATSLPSPVREEAWVRRLFEKAVLGFARVELAPLGWRIKGGTPLGWQASSSSDAMSKLLPGMVTDVILDPPDGGRRIIIDTKFASLLGTGRFGNATLKSGYLYQMYAYLRSQEGLGPQWDTADGLFLHPSIDIAMHEHVSIQRHRIGFATLDLAASASAIRNELRGILLCSSRPA
ncbi:possible mcrC protein [Janthinobacterium agaricidamnosum NBRC 102515 = DSM 9628]|uniref:Possible mcrC protein n=1 Tax=Janthinobacterium agaricidamnosum NBRC 102515 = DSM 9628 TaxID=1349767 RepID=W0V582_9BURK|nr:possible mcrC protein [Janthinobacterium agaricidamnosum NBRC 102515 = DSM 9628]